MTEASAGSSPPHDDAGTLRLLLASASPARARTLRSAGIEPLIQPSDVDEAAVLERARQEGPLDVAASVLLLARAKAEAVASDRSARADVVLGCDSLLDLDGAGMGKPESAEIARERWRRMRGRTGTLHTGHWLISGTRAVGETSSTSVTFADISDAEIDAYVATGEPLAVAGAFTLDGVGGAFVEKVDGDPHGVVGLSLPLLRRLLHGLDIHWTRLWRPPV